MDPQAPRLPVRASRQRSVVRDSLIGAAVGGLVGLVIGLALVWKTLAPGTSAGSRDLLGIILVAAAAALIVLTVTEARARTREKAEEDKRRSFYRNALREIMTTLDEFEDAPDARKRPLFDTLTRSIGELEEHRAYLPPRTGEENAAIFRIGRVWNHALGAARLDDPALTDRDRLIGNNALREAFVATRTQLTRSLSVFQR
ncbi:hypothetical protein [Flavisphingomonas formosensis]|uniref:hypothetical protein n=1 Tax=Flavisphingomonas formosensis TaxID=861534 RepID=UPI0012F92CF9|nr:hypothetical protein [Sphingomonas formosensis]